MNQTPRTNKAQPMTFNYVTHKPGEPTKIEQIELQGTEAAENQMDKEFRQSDDAAKMAVTEFKNGRWQAIIYRAQRDERNRRHFIPMVKMIKLTP